MTNDNPQTYTKQQEDLQVIDNYIRAMAAIQARTRGLDGESLGEGLVLFTNRLMLTTLEKDLIGAAWRFLFENPFTEQIHPAITILRNTEMKPIEIQIADDLSPWLPAPTAGRSPLSLGTG